MVEFIAIACCIWIFWRVIIAFIKERVIIRFTSMITFQYFAKWSLACNTHRIRPCKLTYKLHTQCKGVGTLQISCTFYGLSHWNLELHLNVIVHFKFEHFPNIFYNAKIRVLFRSWASVNIIFNCHSLALAEIWHAVHYRPETSTGDWKNAWQAKRLSSNTEMCLSVFIFPSTGTSVPSHSRKYIPRTSLMHGNKFPSHRGDPNILSSDGLHT